MKRHIYHLDAVQYVKKHSRFVFVLVFILSFPWWYLEINSMLASSETPSIPHLRWPQLPCASYALPYVPAAWDVRIQLIQRLQHLSPMWIQPSCTRDQSYSGYETTTLMHKLSGRLIKYSNLAIFCIHLGRGSCCITSAYDNVPFFNGPKQNHLWGTSLQENQRSRSEIRWTSLNRSQSLRLNCEAVGHSKCPNLKMIVETRIHPKPKCTSREHGLDLDFLYFVWCIALILNLSWFHCKAVWIFLHSNVTKKVKTKFQPSSWNFPRTFFHPMYIVLFVFLVKSWGWYNPGVFSHMTNGHSFFARMSRCILRKLFFWCPSLNLRWFWGGRFPYFFAIFLEWPRLRSL